jgi:hypothetical protein
LFASICFASLGLKQSFVWTNLLGLGGGKGKGISVLKPFFRAAD